MTFQISVLKFQVSLRTRFALGLGAVLLPFLVAAVVGQFYLLPQLIEPLEDIVREFAEKLEPVTHLQKSLLQAAMPVNDYLIHGDPDERRQFAQLHQRVERAFEEASPERFTLAEERTLIRAARADWAQALPLGEQLLRQPDPVGNAAVARDMEQFDAHIERAVSALDEAHGHFHQVIEQSLAQASAARTGALWATFAAFVVAATASLVAGVVLARSVTDPVDTLRQGAARLAEGKLSHRVAIRRHDELGELGAAFNTMAGQLEADQAALEQLATHDGLTGLYNHRTFYVLFGDELARAQRFKRPLSLLLLDIDHFKCVNDMHGHQAGDVVLKGLGELLGREVRAVDRVCRYGGEEITIILPETDLEAAASFAERLRAAVEAQSFDVDAGASLRITVSIGIASWPAHADNAQALVAAVDVAMYAAKQRGRNLVICYEPAPVQPVTPG
ncbi:diguanylate cyclase [Thiobacillus denitrificans]|uniref:diguanylate cyclase n=1 Tax=Thiobacillus denitrificans TaxID=36861 RepID=UPI000753234A|nr:diguanylate cyclase [Thiobacillus denitrificans]